MKSKLAIFTCVLILLISTGLLYTSIKDSVLTQTKETSVTPSNTKDQILFPKGGETLIKGEKYTLKWTGGPKRTQIFLVDTAYESEGVSVSLVDRIYNLHNTGSYEYKIPTYLPDGTYKFEIGELTSKDFKITGN